MKSNPDKLIEVFSQLYLEFSKLQSRVQELEQENKDLMRENKQLRKQFAKLQKTDQKLTQKVDRLESRLAKNTSPHIPSSKELYGNKKVASHEVFPNHLVENDVAVRGRKQELSEIRKNLISVSTPMLIAVGSVVKKQNQRIRYWNIPKTFSIFLKKLS